MNTGKQFEASFKESCGWQGVSCTRLQDAGYRGEERLGTEDASPKRFTIRNICDFICYAPHGTKIWFLELKSREKRIAFKDLDKQAARLFKKYKENIQVHVCGFLFEFSKSPDKSCFFLDIVDYEVLKTALGKKSFGYQDLKKNDVFVKLVDFFVPIGKRTPKMDVKNLML